MARTPKIPGEAQPEQEALEPVPVSSLPNSFEVDAKAITEPVLTRQGWVCPADKPKG